MWSLFLLTVVAGLVTGNNPDRQWQQGLWSKQHDANAILEDGSMCASCVDRQLYLNYTKEEIRRDILRKLDMRIAPDVSAKDVLPQKLLRDLMRSHRAKYGVMADEAVARSDDDTDDHFKTEEIHILAQNRKYKKNFIHLVFFCSKKMTHF